MSSCPGKRYVILEGRPSMGGTWDLFRYPGIRSDSDMHTLGYRFKPWREAKAIADGASILRYVKETAAEYGVDQHIRYEHLAMSASWSSAAAAWTVEALRKDSGETVRFTCNFLLMCAGYYSYRQGYTPEFEGIERFKGTIVHPQQWPEDLDYTGKQVVVIGSGATAMTLVPAMAKDVAHIVMLQRSPTYVVSRPDTDVIANALRKVLPEPLGLRDHALEERRAAAVPLSPHAHASRPGQAEAPRHGAQGARAGLRRRDPLHAQLQSVGPAPLPGAEQRSLRGDPLRQGVDRHRPHRPLHRARHHAAVGQGARGRHHRDRDRASTSSCSARCNSPSTARRSISRRPGPTRA